MFTHRQVGVKDKSQCPQSMVIPLLDLENLESDISLCQKIVTPDLD